MSEPVAFGCAGLSLKLDTDERRSWLTSTAPPLLEQVRAFGYRRAFRVIISVRISILPAGEPRTRASVRAFVQSEPRVTSLVVYLDQRLCSSEGREQATRASAACSRGSANNELLFIEEYSLCAFSDMHSMVRGARPPHRARGRGISILPIALDSTEVLYQLEKIESVLDEIWPRLWPHGHRWGLRLTASWRRLPAEDVLHALKQSGRVPDDVRCNVPELLANVSLSGLSFTTGLCLRHLKRLRCGQVQTRGVCRPTKPRFWTFCRVLLAVGLGLPWRLDPVDTSRSSASHKAIDLPKVMPAETSEAMNTRGRLRHTDFNNDLILSEARSLPLGAPPSATEIPCSKRQDTNQVTNQVTNQATNQVTNQDPHQDPALVALQVTAQKREVLREAASAEVSLESPRSGKRGDRRSASVAKAAVDRARSVAYARNRTCDERGRLVGDRRASFPLTCAKLGYSGSTLEWIEVRYMGKAVEPVTESTVVDELAKSRRTREKPQKEPSVGVMEQGTVLEKLLKLQMESSERIAREQRKSNERLSRENREFHESLLVNSRDATKFQAERIGDLHGALDARFVELLRVQNEVKAALTAASATPSTRDTLIAMGIELGQHLLQALKAASSDE